MYIEIILIFPISISTTTFQTVSVSVLNTISFHFLIAHLNLFSNRHSDK